VSTFRIFHGDADDVVPVKGSREAYKALKAAGADVEYIVLLVIIIQIGSTFLLLFEQPIHKSGIIESRIPAS